MSNIRTDLDALRRGSIVAAMNAGLTLRREPRLPPQARAELHELAESGDQTARIASLQALAAQTDRVSVAILRRALLSEDASLREHAAWVLGDRTPDPVALPDLVATLREGGFPGMLAQLTLERWGLREPALVSGGLVDALAVENEPAPRTRILQTLGLVPSREAPRAHERIGTPSPEVARALARPSGGLRIAQVLLQGRIDGDLQGAGAGDGGGLATLLVSLSRSLGVRPEIDEVVTFARAFVDDSLPDLYSGEREPVAAGSSIERLRFGPRGYLAASSQWEHRVEIERELERAVARAGGVDVAHLRFADAGTFAAARVFTRLGIPVVFTLAPDPHAVLRDAESAGELARESFAAADLEQHYVFRAWLVDWMVRNAAALALLPRPGAQDELSGLLGRSFDTVAPRRLRTIPEGVAVSESRSVAHELTESHPSSLPSGARELASALTALPHERRHLPLLLTVGRFHRVKGLPLLVEAWAGDEEIFEQFNLVVVGGNLDRPTVEERIVLGEIEDVRRRRPETRSGLVLLGHRPNADVARLLHAARTGLPGLAAARGVYVCPSRKEEFGLAVLEAMAAGLPVVAPRSGGPPTYVDDGRNGFLADTATPAGLRAGLRAAAAARFDDALSKRAQRLVAERFTIEAMAEELSAVYRDVTAIPELQAA